MKPRYFRIKKGVPFAYRKMKYVRMSPYTKGNFMLALLSKCEGVVTDWKKGDIFEFTPREVKELRS